ncbi:MAG: hypothetical protein Pg6A_10370 [Termitinemataceae bacterium]|nr:MAG: hypothetical protein Pg6A_10370 [Termitinemataceae bacterium]
MRKLVLVALSFSMAFLSCPDNNWQDTVISNNSTFSVRFKFNNSDEYTIQIGGTPVSFTTTAHQYLEYYSPDKRVKFSYIADDYGYTGKFEDRKSWVVKVDNRLQNPQENVSLSADGWMDVMTGITQGYYNDANHNGIIWTDKPNFKAVSASGFPAVVEYQKTETEFLVTIKWN